MPNGDVITNDVLLGGKVVTKKPDGTVITQGHLYDHTDIPTVTKMPDGTTTY